MPKPAPNKAARVFLSGGQSIPVWVSDSFAVNATDMTENTVHRFIVRGLLRRFFCGKVFVFVQGDRINFIEVEAS